MTVQWPHDKDKKSSCSYTEIKTTTLDSILQSASLPGMPVSMTTACYIIMNKNIQAFSFISDVCWWRRAKIYIYIYLFKHGP